MFFPNHIKEGMQMEHTLCSFYLFLFLFLTGEPKYTDWAEIPYRLHLHSLFHRMVYPPSTTRVWPITKLDAGLASHNTAAAISSGCPRRSIGAALI